MIRLICSVWSNFGVKSWSGPQRIASNTPRSMEYPIAFNRPSAEGHELAYIAQTIQSGQIAGDQGFSKNCHAFLERSLNVNRALVTTSCTHALELAALLLECRPGDEVIVPSFTFVSSANAFVLRGVRPIFCDVRPDTLNLDETKLEALVTPRTRAVVVVHYGGVGCEMDAIMAMAQRHGFVVVEDNAHGLFGKYRGRWLGSFGALATLSFHETKNITCGEGGAILVNDARYIELAEIVREKGTDRARFIRGQVDKYTWVDLGSSYVMSDLLAAFLYAQLESWPGIQARRKAIWEHYHAGLRDLAGLCGLGLPTVPDYCEQAYHMFYLLMGDERQRAGLILHLRSKGIVAVQHYQPLHVSEMGRQFGGRMGQCPVTENISNRLVRLPFFNTLTRSDQDRVIGEIRAFFRQEKGDDIAPLLAVAN